MKYQHTVKFVRVAPKKVRIFAKGLKGLEVKAAEDYLLVQKQKSAVLIGKALKAALNNAEQEGVKTDGAKVLAVSANKGPVFMRRWIRARGRALPKRKPTAHITITIGTKEQKAKAESKKDSK